EIVELSEEAVVLDLLFSFARPQRYPDLHDVKIKTLVGLADAAQKYEVYAAIVTCKILMRTNIPTHPVEVFRYAGKYQYVDFLDDTAPLLL
ncbi:hypothetical protein BDN72DRAFT_740059, partial [Pluteus cervinus]